jgi:hypothetical protein
MDGEQIPENHTLPTGLEPAMERLSGLGVKLPFHMGTFIARALSNETFSSESASLFGSNRIDFKYTGKPRISGNQVTMELQLEATVQLDSNDPVRVAHMQTTFTTSLGRPVILAVRPTDFGGSNHTSVFILQVNEVE